MATVKKWGVVGGTLIALVLLSSCASAPGTPGGQPASGGEWTLVIFLVALFAIFYFLMIRPQRRRQQQHQQLIQQLRRGDRVITIGGMYGEIESISEDSIIIKVHSGATIKMVKNSIAAKVST